jgi:predicted aspartyl protease
MPRFAYNRYYYPPAPTLPVQVSHLFDLQKSEGFEGKLDTGADSTVIPMRLITQFDLMPTGLKRIRSYDGIVRTVRTYYVQIHILEETFVVKVTAANRQNILLGRDLLNQFNLYLHGRALVFEIELALNGFWKPIRWVLRRFTQILARLWNLVRRFNRFSDRNN